MLKIFLSLAGAAVAGMLLGGCQSASDSQSPLTGTVWILEQDSLPGRQANWEKPQQPITLVVDEADRVSGCAGVNRYFGSVRFTGDNQLQFSQMGSTRMAGPGLQYESAYLQALPQADSYQVSGDRLTLQDGGQTLLQFTPGKKAVE